VHVFRGLFPKIIRNNGSLCASASSRLRLAPSCLTEARWPARRLQRYREALRAWHRANGQCR
jgi:hypothetical protein